MIEISFTSVIGTAHSSRILIRFALIIFSIASAQSAVFSEEPPHSESSPLLRSSESTVNHIPPVQIRLQDVGKINVGWNNTMEIGWEVGFVRRQHCDLRLQLSGIEYPKGSNVRWDGVDLWFGGVKGDDTLVSVAYELVRTSSMGGPSAEVQEMFPPPLPEGGFLERTSRITYRRGAACSDLTFDAKAISEHDLISIATDTVVDPDITHINTFDQRRHKPLGLRIEMKRYAWSYDYAEDFVIVECHVENVGFRSGGRIGSENHIKDLMVGIVVEGFIRDFILPAGSPIARDTKGILWDLLTSSPLPGRSHLQEPMNLVWVADSDGDPLDGQFDDRSLTSAFGMRLLSPTLQPTEYSYNWWTTSPGAFFGPDWGPIRNGSKVEFANADRGKPQTDRGKYQLMTNGEIDYPVVE